MHSLWEKRLHPYDQIVPMSSINHIDINFLEKRREGTSVLQQQSESYEAHPTCGSHTSPCLFQHKSSNGTKCSFSVESLLEVHKHNIFTHIQIEEDLSDRILQFLTEAKG